MLGHILSLNYTPRPMLTLVHVFFVDTHLTQYTHGGQVTSSESQFLPFVMWVPRTELRSLVLDTSAFTCWAISLAQWLNNLFKYLGKPIETHHYHHHQWEDNALWRESHRKEHTGHVVDKLVALQSPSCGNFCMRRRVRNVTTWQARTGGTEKLPNDQGHLISSPPIPRRHLGHLLEG